MIGKVMSKNLFAIIFLLFNFTTLYSTAYSASLSVRNGVSTTIGDNFDLTAETGLTADSDILMMPSGIQNGGSGLYLEGNASTVRFEFLGASTESDVESVSLRSFAPNAGGVLSSKSSETGDMIEIFDVSSGYIPFFATSTVTPPCVVSGEISLCIMYMFFQMNGSMTSSGDYNMVAFAEETGNSVIALFGNSTGDLGIDDLAVRISVVPLPPALVLFGGALLGLGWIARRRKNQSHS